MSRVETHPAGSLPTARPLWGDVPVGRSGTKLWHTGWYRTAYLLVVWYYVLLSPLVVVGPRDAVASGFFQPNELMMMPMLRDGFSCRGCYLPSVLYRKGRFYFPFVVIVFPTLFYLYENSKRTHSPLDQDCLVSW